MKRRTLRGFLPWFMAMSLCFVSLVSIGITKSQASYCDPFAPVITITSPAAGGGSYATNQPVVTLAGEVSDDVAVKLVTWSNNSKGGATQGSTDWTSPWHWHWQAKDIPLLEGDNLITVTAVDTAGNSDEATLMVTYIPLPPPSTKVIDNTKAKFVFYFGGTAYNNLDFFTDIGYLKKEKSEVFVMPYNKDVTVTVKVPDPRGDPLKQLQLFTQTIPAGTVTGITKYNYRSGPSGIVQLYLEPNGYTTIYMYLYVDKSNFLPGIRAAMTAAEYKAFIRSIPSYTLTLKIGDVVYSGEAPLIPWDSTEHRQDLYYAK
jgi:hypothetical protein